MNTPTQILNPCPSYENQSQEIKSNSIEDVIRFCDTTVKERDETILKLLSEEGSVDAFRIAFGRFPDRKELEILKKIQEEKKFN